MTIKQHIEFLEDTKKRVPDRFLKSLGVVLASRRGGHKKILNWFGYNVDDKAWIILKGVKS